MQLQILSPAMVLFCLAVSFTPSFCQENKLEFVVKKLDAPPRIDGVLEDEAWKGAELDTGEWLDEYPVYGVVMKQKTIVYAAYDDEALYFAFRCLDTEADKITTNLSRRDDVNNCDWFGVILDSINTRQTSFAHYLNPSGVQADMIRFATDDADVGVDWVWQSGASIDAGGYSLEMRIPLESIRYKGGKETRMGVCFRRAVYRNDEYATWPNKPPGKGLFTIMATLVYRDLHEQHTRELLPSLTYARNSERTNSDAWAVTDNKADVGLSLKYGITSALTLDASFNPDFSQVESDEFQVEVNQRFPIFRTEKRPFFMEGTGIFLMPLSGGDFNMVSHVHTRRIVDPRWGAKFSGSAGKLGFSFLSASDEAQRAGVLDSGGEPAGKRTQFYIGRGVYNLGGDNYVGGVFTTTDSPVGDNRVFGLDSSYRIGRHWLTAYLFQTSTERPSGETAGSGLGAAVGYAYDSMNFGFGVAGEHFDRDFSMDTGFYRRTGITFGHFYGGPYFYPDRKRYPWLQKISTRVEGKIGRDRIAGGDERFFAAALDVIFAGGKTLSFTYGRGLEPWAGRTFDTSALEISGDMIISKSLNLRGTVSWADSLFYDPANPFAGKLVSQVLALTYQPVAQVRQVISYNHVTFDRTADGARLYTVHVLNSQSYYYFSNKFFLRAIVRFDSFEKQILTDFLASFTLMPGTVVYAGYGSLIEKRQWEQDHWVSGAGDYMTSRRSLFFKASYLWRF
jgi:hypothetical protein